MVTLILWGVLAAAPNLAAPGLQCSGIDPALCDAYLEHFVSNLTNRGLTVTTKNDMAQIMGAERQRQLMGCTTESSACLAELTAALGVANLLTGTVAKTESGYVSTLKVLAAADGSTKWSATKRVDTEKELFVFLEEQAGSLVAVVAPGVATAAPSPIVKWIPAMVGGVAAAVGTGLLVASMAEANDLRDIADDPSRAQMELKKLGGDLTLDEYIQTVAQSGRTLQVTGWVVVGAGAAAIASSFIWWLIAPSSPVSAFFAPSPNGASVGVTMELP